MFCHVSVRTMTLLPYAHSFNLEKLIQIAKIISDFKGKEEILLRYSICPKCGGKVRETQRRFGGTEDDPMPDGVYLRVGCEKCDYELHSETIDF